MTLEPRLHYAHGMRAAATYLRVLTAVSVSLIAAAASAEQNDQWADARQLFTTAYAAADAGTGAPQRGDPKALREYPLYPYLQRIRIARSLDGAPDAWSSVDDAARKFLDHHADEPVAADLRTVWLRSLAERAQWRAFVRAYDASVADTALACDLLQARIALNETGGLVKLVVDRWLTAERLPPECEPAFQWLREQGELSDELTAERVKLLLDNGQTGFARIVARRLPEAMASPLLQWAELVEHPQRSIDALLADGRVANRTDENALLAGWAKLARDNPPAALERFQPLVDARQPDTGRLSQYALALALGLAWDRRAGEALNAFAAVDPADLDDYALGWQARAALWARDWQRARRSIEAMSAAQRATPRWQYWAARAAEKLGDSTHARALYEAVLPTDNYFAANAATRLGRGAEPHPDQLPTDAGAVAAIASRPEFVRSHELLRIGLRTGAVREWLSGVAKLDQRLRDQAIRLAAEWEWHDVAVALATRENVFFDYVLLYPRPYDIEVKAAAESANVDSPLLYGMIRQESLFRADAISPSGAIGLAQLMPGTAKRIARADQQPLPSASDLFDPGLNLRLGAAHLRELIDRFDGQQVVALAAYNAGPLAAERWLPEAPIDADIWVENIPYNETRDYVQRVLWHTVVFGWLGSGEAQDFTPWARPITPHRPSVPASSATAG